jgi:hypothetical protein
VIAGVGIVRYTVQVAQRGDHHATIGARRQVPRDSAVIAHGQRLRREFHEPVGCWVRE